MDGKDLLYIEDAHKRKLFYRFTPAAVVSNFVPLVVILHGENQADALHFEYKMWNVLTPLDTFGVENRGSCWLGEDRDFFVKDLLQKLIQQISEEYECEDDIYLYGSSIGGYGAILHGILCKANAVYAHSPRIRLINTNQSDTLKENDLTHFLNRKDDFPIFYLCDNANSNVEDETVYFVDACKKHDIEVRLDFCQTVGESPNHLLKKVLDMFERE